MTLSKSSWVSLHFLYTRLILDLLRPLVDRWSPLTRASHCMTTGTLPFQPNRSLFPGLETGSEYAGLHMLSLGI